MKEGWQREAGSFCPFLPPSIFCVPCYKIFLPIVCFLCYNFFNDRRIAEDYVVLQLTYGKGIFMSNVSSGKKEECEEYFDLLTQSLEAGKDFDLDQYFLPDKREEIKAKPNEDWSEAEIQKKRTPQPVLGSCDFLKKLNPCNWVGCVVPLTKHYGNTLEAFRTTSLSPASVISIARAARFPDFIDFNTPAAHAQCDNGEDGLLKDVEADRQKFISWIANRLKIIKNHAAKGNVAEVLFGLGYVLHGLQDLAVHQGQSNAEHSYNNRVGKCPDDDEKGAELAVTVSSNFVKEYIFGKLQLFTPEFCNQLNRWENQEQWLSKLSPPKIKETAIGAYGFRFKAHKSYEGQLNDGTETTKLDARWVPFDGNGTLPKIEDIRKYFFVPITEAFFKNGV